MRIEGESGRSGQPVRLADAIRQLLQSYRIESRFDEARLVEAWENLVGKPIARRTRKVYVRNKVLFVEMESAALRQDMNLHRQKLMELIRSQFGESAIREIRII